MANLGWSYLTAEDREAILRGVRDGRSYGGPYHVEIYPSDRCNIDCFFCGSKAIRGSDEIGITRLEEITSELREIGTRSVRLAGGGEPLFHREIVRFLELLSERRLPVENLTTNAVLLRTDVARLLLDNCDEITVSLNTGDAESYARMMKTPARNFDRVVENVSTFVRERRKRRSRKPEISLQFLVWKENFRSIPRMYDLARAMRVDSIIFGGLSHLPSELRMNERETDEMMDLYADVVRRDEYRTIATINSFEQNIEARVEAMSSALTAERNRKPKLLRLLHLALRRDFTLSQKLEHHARVAEKVRMERESNGLEDSCIVGWHSMLVRVDGTAAPCCMLQGTDLGNIYRQSVRDVWNGPAYARFRRELSDIIRLRDAWQPDPHEQKTVVPMCGAKSEIPCAVRNFYYRSDLPFLRELSRVTGAIVETAPPEEPDRAVAGHS